MTHSHPLKKITLTVFALIISLSSLSLTALAGPGGGGAPPTINIHDASYMPNSPGQSGWAVGDDGHGNAEILKQQVDGTWQVSMTINHQVLNSIVMLSSSEGYAVGNGGLIYQYQGNGNNKWKSMGSGTHANLRRVKTGAGFVFAVGDNQTALVHFSGGMDGGNWYLLHYVPGSSNFYGGAVVSDGAGGYIGYTVGAAGLIMEYVSATNTWTTLSSPTSADISDVNLSDASNGLATTTSGQVINYASGNWTLETALDMTSNGVLDLSQSGMHAKSRPAALIGATAVVVGNDSSGTGIIGIDRGGNWSVSSPVGQGIQLNYLTQDNSGNIYAVGSNGTIVPVQ